MTAACQSTDAPMGAVGVARAAEIEVRVGAMTRKVVMGGFASADFPDKAPAEMASLAPEEQLALIWRNARFLGVDSLLGEVDANLRTDRISEGIVRSAGVTPAAPGDQQSFFPAINRNSFHFELKLKRFGLTMKSESPVINSARIDQIPPVGSLYSLENAVRFRRSSESTNILSVVLPSVEVKACNVKLHVNGGIDLRIISCNDDGANVSIQAEAKAVVGRDIGATWMIWPPPPAVLGEPKGTLRLGNNSPVVFSFVANRDMFYQAKFLAIASSYPFDTSASNAVLVPSLM